MYSLINEHCPRGAIGRRQRIQNPYSVGSNPSEGTKIMCKHKHELTAIIYDKRGKILSVGKNSYVKTHPKMAEFAAKMGEPYKQFIHAEIDAIIRCKDLTKAYKISVFRIMKDGSYGMAKPCNICSHAIKESGIKVIEHT